MKSFSSREIIKILEQDGWFLLGAREDTTSSTRQSRERSRFLILRKM